ncbi:MAG: PilZ domain-containing protein [Synergistetes bacterium]|nr:PilZ domain-containing protein [Synergistota bacterium]MDW8193052.1 PilZ domain-containing protein [Synergistota bacterium]
MKEGVLYEGMSVELELGKNICLKGRILRPTLDGNLVIVFDRGAVLPQVRPGEKVNIIWNEKGKLFKGEAEIRGRGGKIIPFLEVSSPHAFVPIERRRHRRVKALIPVEYRKVSGGLFKSTHTIDISGGGLRLKVDDDIEVDDELEVLIYLPESDVISALARVVRIEERGDEREAGLEFMIIDERFRRNIINFVFKTELKERQKVG